MIREWIRKLTQNRRDRNLARLKDEESKQREIHELNIEFFRKLRRLEKIKQLIRKRKEDAKAERQYRRNFRALEMEWIGQRFVHNLRPLRFPVEEVERHISKSPRAQEPYSREDVLNILRHIAEEYDPNRVKEVPNWLNSERA